MLYFKLEMNRTGLDFQLQSYNATLYGKFLYANNKKHIIHI